jgi:nucleotide-binding universal stress UspA family protein
MRILLAVGEKNDPAAFSGYLAGRFDGAAVEVDVLSVVEERTTAKRATVGASVASELSEIHEFRRVRLHTRTGSAVEEIVAASEQWRSALVLLGAPRPRGLLTAFGSGSVARDVAARARCAVELVRAPGSTVGGHGNRVLAVVDVERLDEFPFEELQFQSSPWKGAGALRVVGVARGVLEPSAAEASPAAMLRSLERGEQDRAWAEARLGRVCRALAEIWGGRVAVDYRFVEGKTRDVALASAAQFRASLLVLDTPATDGALRGWFSRLSPAALTMAAPCSVLLLRAASRNEAHETASGAQPLRSFP